MIVPWNCTAPLEILILFCGVFCGTCETMTTYSLVERGSPNTLSYRAYFAGPNGFISPIHDIPLYASNDPESPTFNMIVEIPRWTNAKMEVNKEETLNPLKQDVKKGKLRFVDNCFPHHGYIWNYGALPQTWEDPDHIDEHTQMRGDKDPIDVCEIGYKVQDRGAIIQVKVLGIMALIDEGETDWKVIAIDVTDPQAKDLNDINDVEKLMPGFIRATNEWFKIYKIPTGKPPNEFAFGGEAKDKKFALEVIKQGNEHWKQVLKKKAEDSPLSLVNTTITSSATMVSQEEAKAIVDKTDLFGAAAPIPDEADKWHYVSL